MVIILVSAAVWGLSELGDSGGGQRQQTEQEIQTANADAQAALLTECVPRGLSVAVLNHRTGQAWLGWSGCESRSDVLYHVFDNGTEIASIVNAGTSVDLETGTQHCFRVVAELGFSPVGQPPYGPMTEQSDEYCVVGVPTS